MNSAQCYFYDAINVYDVSVHHNLLLPATTSLKSMFCVAMTLIRHQGLKRPMAMILDSLLRRRFDHDAMQIFMVLKIMDNSK